MRISEMTTKKFLIVRRFELFRGFASEKYMHQTFYIDIDEEITSLISRLRKSKTKENIFVVPRRALILQSAVNLKLLKKESVKLKRKIMIITQDRQGKDLAEKIGILTQSSLDGFEDSEEVREDFNPKIKSKNKSHENMSKLIDKIGSESFYEEAVEVSHSIDFPKKGKGSQPSTEEYVRKDVPEREVSQNGKKTVFFDIFRGTKKTEESSRKELVEKKEKKIKEVKISHAQPSSFPEGEKRREKEIQYFFEDREEQKTEKPARKTIKIQSRMRKFFIFFGFSFLVVVMVAFSLFFLPKANVHLKGKIQEVELGVEIKGDIRKTSIDFENKIIPARIIEANTTSEVSFFATGKSDTTGQKARGKITIYNEFSVAPQSLVATTRVITAEKKVFRLVKGVIVPGMIKLGNESRPGVIEADVIADQAGAEYNIGPSEFKIPGFQGSPKYEKFYAKSTQAMIGGNSSGNQATVVSEMDIEQAKKNLAEKISIDFESKTKESLKEDEVILPESIEKKEIIYSLPEKGTAVESFSGKAEMNARAVVFREKDLKSIIARMAAEKGNIIGNTRMAMNEIVLEYGQPVTDFVESFILIKVHARTVYKPKINIKEIKNKLAGKNEDQVRGIMNDYPEIENMEVEFKPDFFPTKFPQYGKMITVTAENFIAE